VCGLLPGGEVVILVGILVRSHFGR
jgi:hypothetical protein